MDMSTGEIKTYDCESLKKEQLSRATLGIPLLAELGGSPDIDCSKCGGKGFTGVNVDTGLKQVCKCTRKERKV